MPQHICAPLEAVEASITGGNLSALNELRRLAKEESLPVYLVGGPVRDVLIGMPIRDLDFVVEGDAPGLADRLGKELGATVVRHEAFGTASLALPGGRVDLATARREVYLKPASLPQVTPASIHEDLARRDFSINTLALPLFDDQPRLLDLHGGVEDIKNGLVRILHPNSFIDDPTRVLRAIRYEQRLGFQMEPETLSRLRDATGQMALLTGDRLRHELERILEERHPAPVLERAAQLGALQGIHPSLGNTEAVAQLASGQPVLVYLAALTFPLSSQEAEAVIQRLNMPGPWAEVVRHTGELKRLEPELSVDNLPPSCLTGLIERFSEQALVAVSRFSSSPLVAQRIERYLTEHRHVSPFLHGQDLLDMGIPVGPLVGQVLQELRNAKLDGKVHTEADERNWVLVSLAREGPSADE